MPNHKDQNICSQCNKPIVYDVSLTSNKGRWVHVEGNPRHVASPIPSGLNSDRIIRKQTPVDLIDFFADNASLAKQIHQFNLDMGWWDEYLKDKQARFETAMMLVVSELAEAMEGCRKDLMDDKLPEFKMFDVELADAMIRLLDMCGAYGVEDFERPPRQYIDRLVKATKPEQLWLTIAVGADAVFTNPLLCIVRMIASVETLADIHKIDLRKIMRLKMEFNATREDHKRENREKEGGKKF